VTAAVNPTPEDPLPVVAIAKGAKFNTNRSICDFPTDGSPISKILISLILLSGKANITLLNEFHFLNFFLPLPASIAKGTF
jgi:hypothetical protein